MGKGGGDGDGEKQGDVSDVGNAKATGLGSALHVGVREDAQVSRACQPRWVMVPFTENQACEEGQLWGP